jgi:hypothetical protein
MTSDTTYTPLILKQNIWLDAKQIGVVLWLSHIRERVCCLCLGFWRS